MLQRRNYDEIPVQRASLYFRYNVYDFLSFFTFCFFKEVVASNLIYPPPRIRPTFLGNKLRMSWSIDTYANLSLFTLPCVVRKQVTEHVHTSMLFIPFPG